MTNQTTWKPLIFYLHLTVLDVNMEEIYLRCRICAVKKAKAVDIFSEKGKRLEILEKIAQCLQIKVFPEDDLPKKVCVDCCRKLENSCEFIDGSIHAQITLQADIDRIKEIVVVEHTSTSKTVKDILKTKIKSNVRRRKQLAFTIKRVPKRKAKENLHYTETYYSDDNDSFDNECGMLENDDQGEDDKEDKEEKEQEENEIDPSRKAQKRKNGSERIRLDKYYTWQCTDCPKILTTPQELIDHHTDEHNQPVRYQCVECAKVYSVYRKFSRHVRLHRNHDKFKCDECGKTFATKQSLGSHAIFHSTDRPHVCEHCGKTFRQRGSLYVHRRIHQLDHKQFSCHECGKQLVSSQALEVHLKSHTGCRDYTCELCGKSFTVKQGLVYHMLSHSGDRPHSCEVCGMRCKTLYLLKKHMTTHSDVKKHQCDVCGKQFRERGTLQQHTRIHTGAMPYSCEFCSKSFRFQGALTIHRRQHTGERPYSCPDCTRDFTNWANYNKHIKRRHGRTAKKNYSDPTFYSDHPNKTTPLAVETPRGGERTTQAPTNESSPSNDGATDESKITPRFQKVDTIVTDKLRPLVNEIICDETVKVTPDNGYMPPYLQTSHFTLNHVPAPECYLSM